MKRVLIHSIAPSHWASYAVNGDDSGLTAEEVAQCNSWLEWVHAGSPVDCKDVGFRNRHDASRVGVLACGCQEYTFLGEPLREGIA